MTEQDELRERIAKALATGIMGGWGSADWDCVSSGIRNGWLNAADDVLAAYPSVMERHRHDLHTKRMIASFGMLAAAFGNLRNTMNDAQTAFAAMSNAYNKATLTETEK